MSPSAQSRAWRVFWLDGMAGTGKSTIARTIARRCADAKMLGASFFFSRDGGDLANVRKFVTTVAVQMAVRVPALRPYICRAVRAALHGISAMALQDQWAQLVLEPLAALKAARKWSLRQQQPIVIVLDALDECDSEGDTAAILGLLSMGASAKHSFLRVFMTSRPESSIRYGMRCIPKSVQHHVVLHHIDPTAIDNDISKYITDHLRLIGTEFPLGPDWPGAESVDSLVERAGGLFIWASTACRFVSQGKAFAKDHLRELLRQDYSNTDPDRSLDSIYLMVLQSALAGNYSEEQVLELIATLNAILGTMIVLAAPLDALSLALVSAQSADAVEKALYGLHSILNVSTVSRHPIRLHHSTFREFIVNPERCLDLRFLVDEKNPSPNTGH